jgi:uncharacterized oxidoreductase
MTFSNHTVFITGGASGIGFGLAELFTAAGSKVVICGRRIKALERAKEQLPGSEIIQCDLSIENERIKLAETLKNKFPGLNILINNAGIQQRINIDDPGFWEKAKEEIATNLTAPIHLTHLLLPALINKENPVIINITSGLAFVPLVFVPVYCTTKAGFHSFTLSLRHQIKNTKVRVIEIIPPAVNTDLGGPGVHNFAIPLKEFINAVRKQLENDSIEITYGTSELLHKTAQEQFNEAFKRMNP